MHDLILNKSDNLDKSGTQELCQAVRVPNTNILNSAAAAAAATRLGQHGCRYEGADVQTARLTGNRQTGNRQITRQTDR